MDFVTTVLPSFLPSLLSAVSGLAGVWLGGHLTSKRELQRDKAKSEKETVYLAVLVSAHLDRLADECAAVAYDDGMQEGRLPDDQGSREPLEPLPKFQPLELDVEWKSLPAELMYGILNLQHKIEQIDLYVRQIGHNDFPPDFSDFFEARQISFAELGLEVIRLARLLRAHAALPAPQAILDKWDRDEAIQERLDILTTRVEARKQKILQRNSPLV